MTAGKGDNSFPRVEERASRQMVKFTFFKLDAAWRRLSPRAQLSGKEDFIKSVQQFRRRMLLRPYTLFGIRGDVDFLLWQVAESPEVFQEFAAALFSTTLGPYLSTPYSYLAMTRRSIYDIPGEPDGDLERLVIQPTNEKYLFVYPFVKTRAWYALPEEDRQRMMNEHVEVGRRYPSVKLNTTYSYGLDDQEFVVAFETNSPADFLDLVMDLRETEASQYTLRDTPLFPCFSCSLPEMLNSLGGARLMVEEAAGDGRTEWVPVARREEVTGEEGIMVYAGGRQVAIFRVENELYAVDNRCPHARGPLSAGRVEEHRLTCPWHEATFDLRTGAVISGVAPAAVPTYPVRENDGMIEVYVAAEG